MTSYPLCLPPLSSDDMDGPVEDIGSRSCVTRFVKTLLSIMEHGVKPHSKHLTEYFAFLYEFAKMGEEEVRGGWGWRGKVKRGAGGVR